MVFNSLLLLVDKERKGVFNFLKELFYVSNYELSQDEKAYIYNSLIEYSKQEKKSYDVFMSFFKRKEGLYNVLTLLSPDNLYGFFINRERVYITNLDEKALTLTICYLNTFGFGNIQN